ncbi:MAG: hypothetical protein ICV60_12855 [Pyrinomonadaceae bacterium]|nr:hypothetical protein [Pyrinomonadaceae bacterium]
MAQRIAACLVIFLAVLTAWSAPGQAQPKDKIKIVNIVPDSLILGDKRREVTVEIEYELETKKEGIIYLGFNTDKPEQYVITESVRVKKGKGRVTLKSKVKAVDWQGLAPFYAYANISEYPHPSPWKALDFVTAEIKIKRR